MEAVSRIDASQLQRAVDMMPASVIGVGNEISVTATPAPNWHDAGTARSASQELLAAILGHHLDERRPAAGQQLCIRRRLAAQHQT